MRTIESKHVVIVVSKKLVYSLVDEETFALRKDEDPNVVNVVRGKMNKRRFIRHMEQQKDYEDFQKHLKRWYDHFNDK